MCVCTCLFSVLIDPSILFHTKRGRERGIYIYIERGGGVERRWISNEGERGGFRQGRVECSWFWLHGVKQAITTDTPRISRSNAASPEYPAIFPSKGGHFPSIPRRGGEVGYGPQHAPKRIYPTETTKKRGGKWYHVTLLFDSFRFS